MRAMVLPVGPQELGLVTARLAQAPPPQGLGLSRNALRWRVQSGRWQRLHRGVYLTRVGPVDWLTRAGAALLAYGDEAALGGASAAYLWGLGPQPAQVHVVVATSARVREQVGTRLRRTDEPRVFDRWPRRTTLEATVVDLAAAGTADDLAALLHQALRERRTTPARLRAELDRRSRHPQRALVAALLAETAAGSEGALEVRFVRGVLRRHGLPEGEAQLRLAGGRRADRGFREFGVLVELDGQLYHPVQRRVADRAKSNTAARAAWLLLRYGWAEVVDTPCRTAVEMLDVLRERGWRGRPRACMPRCPVVTRFP